MNRLLLILRTGQPLLEKGRKVRASAHQLGLWDESQHPRETTSHDGKRPGEFARKSELSREDEAREAKRKFQETLDRTEFEHLRPLKDHEECFAWNPATGEQVFHKGGGATSVEFTDEEASKFAGTIFTHNHPLGWQFPESDLRHNGNSFSKEDLRLAVFWGLREIRAVTPTRRFVLKPPIGQVVFDRADDPKLLDIMKQAETHVRSEFTRAIAEGKMSIPEAENRHGDTVARIIAGHMGYRYEVIDG